MHCQHMYMYMYMHVQCVSAADQTTTYMYMYGLCKGKIKLAYSLFWNMAKLMEDNMATVNRELLAQVTIRMQRALCVCVCIS